MKVKIVLYGPGGLVSKQIIDVSNDDPAEVSVQIHDAMECWPIGPGDTIMITEAWKGLTTWKGRS